MGVDDDDGSKPNDDAAMVVVVRLAKRRLFESSSSSSPRVVVLGKERTFFQHITPLLPVDRQTDEKKKLKWRIKNRPKFSVDSFLKILEKNEREVFTPFIECT